MSEVDLLSILFCGPGDKGFPLGVLRAGGRGDNRPLEYAPSKIAELRVLFGLGTGVTCFAKTLSSNSMRMFVAFSHPDIVSNDPMQARSGANSIAVSS